MPAPVNASMKAPPKWTLPVVIVALIVGLVVVGRKHRDAIENPLVDLIIITIGVYALGMAGRAIAGKIGNPGMASFFGAPSSATSPIV